MSEFTRRIFIVLLLCAGTAETAISSEGAIQYTPQELIEKIIESESQIKDVQADYLFYETDTNIPLIYAHWAYQADKELLASLDYEKAGNNPGHTISRKVIFSLDSEQRFSFFEEDILRGRKGGLIRAPSPFDYDSFNGKMAPKSLLGFGLGKRISLGQALQEAQKVEIKRAEHVDGHECLVLESCGIKSPESSYDIRIWIDIERGFRPLIIEKFYNTLGNRKYEPFERLSNKIYDIKLRNINGIWFPIEAKRETFRYEQVLPPELEGLTEEQARQKFTAEELEKIAQKIKEVAVLSVPARKSLLDVNSIRINQGISPEKFIIKPPIGCEVIDEIEDKRYTVENGQGNHLELEISYLKLKSFAPPEFMKVIYPDTLIGCSLHDLSQFQINLDPETIQGKPLLLCIWDMRQRPSRAFIKELAGQVPQLEQKNLVVVGVQASKVTEDELIEWTTANGIFFPVIISETDEQQTQLSFAAKSLPWLILTDKNHIVTAEGFNLDELDDKIK